MRMPKFSCDRPAVECGCPECCAFVAAIRRKRRSPRQSMHLDVDEIEVELAMAGDRPYTMTRGSILEVVARMTEHGQSARLIATALRIDPRSICRYRAILRDQARLP